LTFGFSISGQIRSLEIGDRYIKEWIPHLAPTTASEYCSALRGFFKWCLENKSWPCVNSVLRFLEVKRALGYSDSGAYKLVCALSGWYSSMDSDFDIANNHRVKQKLKILATVWQKHNKVPRTPLLVEDINKIIKVHPPGANKQHWQGFIVLTWVFLLRHKEALAMMPEHLKHYKDNQGNKIWHLTIPVGKTSKGEKDPQKSFFDEEDIPLQYIPFLLWFHKQPRDGSFKWIVSSSYHHLKCLRSAMRVSKENEQEICFHGTRHGRATWLTSMAKYSLPDLMRVGRWDSTQSARGYVHA